MAPEYPATRKSRINPSALAARIKAGICGGIFVPRQRLVEIDLMGQFGVSRACVREALRQLEADGLVQIIKNQGAMVRHVTRKEVLDGLDILDALAIFAVEKATINIARKAVRLKLEKSLAHSRAFRAGIGLNQPPIDFLREANRFWTSITSSLGNPMFDEAQKRFQGILQRILLTGLTSAPAPEDWLMLHEDLLVAMIEGDLQKARICYDEASEHGRKVLMSLPDEAFG